MAVSCYWQIFVHSVTQSSTTPAISCVHVAPHVAEVSRITDADSRPGGSNSLGDGLAASTVLKDVHIKEGTFYVTTLIIPKQESTSGSCQALNEEEIFAIQNEQSLFPVGWIHTHPSQSCFMSSIDLHTQYSYQVMVPEAVAIVMAPTDNSRSYGIFRISDPGGMSILSQCQEDGFHPHRELIDGSSIYESCSNVYINPNLRLEICDLR
ncbi:AMSH-like ubiquitin thioesterase 2 isoform X2 [Cornus florida]|uniref:AMSH-like ubiquitin thioesterase 2 isoform X2 n=1 Tax=Cornus florida TaxID=4283 RepID=UPI002898B0A8|nr:AMSH-like ubiquitin thioesterase 2 isoform X2 [Cornus florida]